MAHTKLFPVTVVGSWTRPDWLIHALRRRQAGEISAGEFAQVADEAVLAAIKYQEDAGVDIVSDGEMRRDNFYSFVVEKLGGMRLMKLSQLLDYMKDRAGFEEILRALDVPAFAIKSPIAVEKVVERDGIALDEARFLKEHTTRQTKVPIPGPYLLTRSSWFEGLSDKAYPTREDLARGSVAKRRVHEPSRLAVERRDRPSHGEVEVCQPVDRLGGAERRRGTAAIRRLRARPTCHRAMSLRASVGRPRPLNRAPIPLRSWRSGCPRRGLTLRSTASETYLAPVQNPDRNCWPGRISKARILPVGSMGRSASSMRWKLPA